MAAPQFTEPGQPNYVSVEADNGTGLQVRYDSKDNFRPWGKAITVKLVKGFLREEERKPSSLLRSFPKSITWVLERRSPWPFRERFPKFRLHS